MSKTKVSLYTGTIAPRYTIFTNSHVNMDEEHKICKFCAVGRDLVEVNRSESPKMVSLLTSDSVLFNIPEVTAKRIGVLKTLLEDVCLDDPKGIIPLLRVEARIFSIILKWLQHWTVWVDVSEQLKKDLATVVEVQKAANYLDISPLERVAAVLIAKAIAVRSLGDMRRDLHSNWFPFNKHDANQGEENPFAAVSDDGDSS